MIVQKVHAQHEVKNLQGRSIRLDIIAIDEGGRVYNIEIQRSDKGASIKRARYNSSLLDANVTEPGMIMKISQRPMLFLLQGMMY